MTLTDKEVYDQLMKLPGPCPRCKKEKWQGRVCEHCGFDQVDNTYPYGRKKVRL